MTAVVNYALDDGTVVRFEIEPGPGFRPAGPDEVVGRVREAVTPAVEGCAGRAGEGAGGRARQNRGQVRDQGEWHRELAGR